MFFPPCTWKNRWFFRSRLRRSRCFYSGFTGSRAKKEASVSLCVWRTFSFARFRQCRSVLTPNPVGTEFLFDRTLEKPSRVSHTRLRRLLHLHVCSVFSSWRHSSYSLVGGIGALQFSEALWENRKLIWKTPVEDRCLLEKIYRKTSIVPLVPLALAIPSHEVSSAFGTLSVAHVYAKSLSYFGTGHSTRQLLHSQKFELFRYRTFNT